MPRAFERVVELVQPPMIAPLRVLLVPAALARSGMGTGNKPMDLMFGLLLAFLLGAVCRCLKKCVHRRIHEAIRDGVVGTQFRFHEKFCAGLQNGCELRAQRRKEIGERKRSNTQPEERN